MEMYGFVHSKNLMVSIVESYEDSLLDTQKGQELVMKGDFICTDVSGDQLVVSPEYVNAMKKVKIVTNPTQKIQSPFVQEYMRQLNEMDNLIQQESDSYINGEQDGWKIVK